MRLFTIAVLLLTLIASRQAVSQDDHRWQYYITTHLNLYAPISSDDRMYPVIGYDKDYKPKILIGGFGAGFAAWRKLNEHTSLRLQGSISRIAYWNPPIDVRDPSNNPLGTLQASSTDYSIGALGLIHHNFSERFSAGAGAGFRTLLVHVDRFRTSGYTSTDPRTGSNGLYKPVMPFVPVEISYALDKVVFNLRYEQSLLRKYNNEIDNIRKDSYGLIVFEVGVKL